MPGKAVSGKDGAGAVVVLYGGGTWFGTPRDVAIGVPGENLEGITDTGGALVLYGTVADGLKSGDATWFTRASVDSGTLNGKARLGFSVR